MASAYWDNTYDEAFGPRGPRTGRQRKERHNEWVEDMDMLVVEMKIDAEILARRNVTRWKRLSREDKDRLAAAEQGWSAPYRKRNMQEPIHPDPPMPTELPSPKFAKINAKPSGIDVRTRKDFLRGKRKTKSKRINGLPSQWFEPVKEDN